MELATLEWRRALFLHRHDELNADFVRYVYGLCVITYGLVIVALQPGNLAQLVECYGYIPTVPSFSKQRESLLEPRTRKSA